MAICDNLQNFLGSPTIQFAEDNISGCLAQPANTFSNLAFILVGVWCIFLLRKTKFKDLYLFPLSFIIIGLSSGFYHATATFVGQFFDFFSIYILGSVLLYFAIKHFIKSKFWLIVGLSIFTILLGFILWFLPFLRIIIAIIELFALIYLGRKNWSKHVNTKPFKTALLVFVGSFIVWNLDLFYIWNIDTVEHFINGHALWHILNSISLYFAFRYYLEREKMLAEG